MSNPFKLKNNLVCFHLPCMHGHVLPEKRQSYDQQNQSLKKIAIQLKNNLEFGTY